MQTKRLSCSWTVETGSFIFAVFNAIVASITVLIGLGFTLHAVYEHFQRGNEKYFDALTTGSMVMATTGAGISFAFAVILCKGVYERNAEFVKWYFVYGIVVIVLYLATAISLIMILIDVDGDSDMLISFIAIIVLSLLFSPILVMIRFTYKKFEQESEANDQYRQILTGKV